MLSILFVLIMSYTTSPLYGQGYTFAGDSTIFQLIGKAWSDGYVPYLELFDHKGPVIFFIDMLGFSLCGNKIGVCLIQIISIFISAIFVYKLVRMKTTSWMALLGTVITFLSLSYTYSAGNSTEEFSLPFLCASVYFIFKYYNNMDNSVKHPRQYAFFYGVSFSAMLLMRVTNAVILCSFVLAIMIYLILKKEWKNLFQNAVYFILGCFVIIVPFYLYFNHFGVAYDMLYATILYNMKYATNMGTKNIKECLQLLSFSYPLLILVFVDLTYLIKKRNWMSLGVLLAAVLELYLFYSSALFGHYYMVLLICLPMAIFFVLDEKEYFMSSALLKNCMIVTTLICVLYSGYKSAYACLSSLIGFENNNILAIELNEKNNSLASVIPEEERDSVASYNVGSNWFLDTGIYPCYKYFTLQEWQGKFDSDLENNVTEYFTSGEAKWIVSSIQINNDEIQKYLDEQYRVVGIDDTYLLRVRKK